MDGALFPVRPKRKYADQPGKFLWELSGYKEGDGHPPAVVFNI
jgi:hypothetical protein